MPAKNGRQTPSGAVATRTTSTTIAHLSDESFESLGLHPVLERSISEVFQYTTMTKVQASATPVCMLGEDVVAKAKTGTGKTLAFLLPALHQVLTDGPDGSIQILVLSPTRELATQTAEEAKGLLHFRPQLKVMTMLGGTNMRTEVTSFKTQAPMVLVATPGRLQDHLENSGLAPLLENMWVLILDEADQLLDMGFRPAIEKILKVLPAREDRQTLLFSATFPAQLQAITQFALRPGHKVVDCIGASEEASNAQVEQSLLVISFEDIFATVAAVLMDLTHEPHKIIVFLETARETGLYAELFTAMKLPGTTILEIHSRKSQNQRTKTSDLFRDSQNAILFSSDVSARGMDYPDVTFVLQVGCPSDRAQYLHRLGRTARAGQDGGGLLVLCDFEQYFLQLLKDLPMRRYTPPQKTALSKAQRLVDSAMPRVHANNSNIGPQAYQAWLGQHKSSLSKLKWTPAELVEWANYFATDIMGLPEVPALEPKTVGMMGLKGVPGLVINRGGSKDKGNSKGDTSAKVESVDERTVGKARQKGSTAALDLNGGGGKGKGKGKKDLMEYDEAPAAEAKPNGKNGPKGVGKGKEKGKRVFPQYSENPPRFPELAGEEKPAGKSGSKGESRADYDKGSSKQDSYKGAGKSNRGFTEYPNMSAVEAKTAGKQESKGMSKQDSYKDTGKGKKDFSDWRGGPSWDENRSEGTSKGKRDDNRSEGTGKGKRDFSDWRGGPSRDENQSEGTSKGKRDDNRSEGTGKGKRDFSDWRPSWDENRSEGTGKGKRDDNRSEGTGKGKRDFSDWRGGPSRDENRSEGTGKGKRDFSDWRGGPSWDENGSGYKGQGKSKR